MNYPTTAAPYFIRRKQEKETYGISSSTIDRLITRGLFPKRKRIGPGCVGTLREDGKRALEQILADSEEA